MQSNLAYFDDANVTTRIADLILHGREFYSDRDFPIYLLYTQKGIRLEQIRSIAHDIALTVAPSAIDGEESADLITFGSYCELFHLVPGVQSPTGANDLNFEIAYLRNEGAVQRTMIEPVQDWLRKHKVPLPGAKKEALRKDIRHQALTLLGMAIDNDNALDKALRKAIDDGVQVCDLRRQISGILIDSTLPRTENITSIRHVFERLHNVGLLDEGMLEAAVPTNQPMRLRTQVILTLADISDKVDTSIRIHNVSNNDLTYIHKLIGTASGDKSSILEVISQIASDNVERIGGGYAFGTALYDAYASGLISIDTTKDIALSRLRRYRGNGELAEIVALQALVVKNSILTAEEAGVT